MSASTEFQWAVDFFNLTPKLTPQKVNTVKTLAQRDEDFGKMSGALTTLLLRAAQTGLNTPGDFFQACARRFRSNVCLREVASDRSFTYGEVDLRANQVAHWARAQGLKTKDVVGLMMENCCEFMWTYIGLSKAGLTIALINTNLSGDALAHAVALAKAPVFIVSVKYAKQWESSKSDFVAKGVRTSVWWAVGINTHLPLPTSAKQGHVVDSAIAKRPTAQPPKAWRAGIGMLDPCFYIYTSGTTGYSKATRFPSMVYIGCSNFNMQMQFTEKDVVYNPLPYYHSAGLIVVSAGTFYHGASLVIKEKFSPRQFWKDVKKFKCTATIYIGELWTYLLNQPVTPEEKNNTLQKIVGNGLRENVWRAMERRFDIPTVVEFYGQSEQPKGRVRKAGGFANSFGKQGAVGYLPQDILNNEEKRNVYLKFDVETQRPKRFADGFCRRAEFGEPGLNVSELIVEEHESDTYTDKTASEKPLIRDVFEKGDLYYSSGDLLRQDADGFIYFVDRTGDTFRWKGENVSTNEVCTVISTFGQVEEANVYGVEIPGEGGRAGMASIVVKEGLELDIPALQKHTESLPSYARPVFLRISKSGENNKTSTFKFQKHVYQDQGFDPNKCSPDELWYSNRNGPYVPVTDEVFAQLQRGAMVQSKL